MHAIGGNRVRQRDIVVDDQRYAVGVAQLPERSGFAVTPCRIRAFVAVLQQSRATCKRLRHHGNKIGARTIGNHVQAAARGLCERFQIAISDVWIGRSAMMHAFALLDELRECAVPPHPIAIIEARQ